MLNAALHGMLGGVIEQQAMERRTICFPHHGTQSVLQHGDPGFKDEINRLYASDENNALEELIALKASLRHLSTDDFWSAMTEGMSKMLGAEICFIMKRVLVDDQESAVEMPPIGAPGACIMAAALHYCANDGSKETYKSTKFHAYGCPCAYMRHDKVFVIPDRLNDFITNNPNQLPTPCEAYIAVPLFEEGKCFGHFGAMWSCEGAAQRKLSWAFIEMILHSLEDMISQRFSDGANFIRKPSAVTEGSRVIPHDAVTLAQSLRPWAGSLSHELRTPMQGIVGMLDVMYATVQEAIVTQGDSRVRQVFETLKDNIETVQDSSRRAVEAADNVVHAYDMDMSVPDAPPQLPDEQSESSLHTTNSSERRPEILVAGSNLPLARPNKRRREEAFARSGSNASSSKAPRLGRTSESSCRCSENTAQGEEERSQADAIAKIASVPGMTADDDTSPAADTTPSFANRNIAPGLRHTSLRELLQFVINDCLKIGGRPDSAFAQETELGEIIEVRTRGSDGSSGQKLIEWRIDSSVPTTMFVDEKDLTKLISCVVLNALKFTDHAEGKVAVAASMRNRGRYLSVKVSDNGPGIPADFLPKLFKPFSQENTSITRSSEGLGLGLMVAKGIARKLGGDLMCTHAKTNGDKRGTEFEIKIPMQAGETISRAGSPYGSPLPQKAQLAKNPAQQHIRPPPATVGSPSSLSRALHEAVSGPTFFAPSLELPSTATSPTHTPPTPPSPRTACLSDGSTSPTSAPEAPVSRPRYRKAVSSAPTIDRELASKYPLTFLVAEDNKINRKLLVNMLSKFGYTNVHEAHDGTEAVRQMKAHEDEVDVVLMDLWMPLMDGYEATKKILSSGGKRPTVLAVTADVTDGALGKAAEVGMKGYMTKPYKLADLQRLIEEYCASNLEAVAVPLPGVRPTAVA